MCRQSMHTKAIAPSRQTLRHRREAVGEEADERGLGHLARRHGELAVAHLARAADVAIDRHIVGRIGEDEVDPLAGEQPLVGGRIARVAAEQPVTAQPPDLAWPA